MSNGRVRSVDIDDDFLTTYNGLRALEKETTSKMSSFVSVGRRKTADTKSSGGYVKRSDRYRHTLDTGLKPD